MVLLLLTAFIVRLKKKQAEVGLSAETPTKMSATMRARLQSFVTSEMQAVTPSPLLHNEVCDMFIRCGEKGEAIPSRYKWTCPVCKMDSSRIQCSKCKKITQEGPVKSRVTNQNFVCAACFSIKRATREQTKKEKKKLSNQKRYKKPMVDRVRIEDSTTNDVGVGGRDEDDDDDDDYDDADEEEEEEEDEEEEGDDEEEEKDSIVEALRVAHQKEITKVKAAALQAAEKSKKAEEAVDKSNAMIRILTA